MAITSTDIQNQSFKIERRGYDVDEVDVFLERVSSEVDALNQEVATLKKQLAEAKRAAAANAQATVAMAVPATDKGMTDTEKDDLIAELRAKLVDRKAEDSAIAQALIVAQRTGDEIVSKSKADAELTRQNAEEEARRILDKANAEKQRVIDHINDLNESREQIRTQYQDLLKEFIGNATMRLAEIGGDTPAPAFVDDFAVDYSAATASRREPSVAAATYTTPVSSASAAPAAFKPSSAAKDLTGYGDADATFAFDEID